MTTRANDFWTAVVISVVVTLGLTALLQFLLSTTVICLADKTC